MSVVVLTYATHSQGYFEALRESCRRFGYDLRILGLGEKWRGYGRKFTAVIEELSSLAPDQLVMFVDAFDVFMCGPASDAIKGFQKAGSPPMLVGASRSMLLGDAFQRQLFQDTHESPQCTDSPYSMLCSGTFMCTAANGHRLLSSLLPIDEAADDQILLASLRNKHGDATIKLDCHFFVFATLMPPFLHMAVPEKDEISIVDKDGALRVYSGVTKTYPCVVHGPANAVLSPIINAMKLTTPTDVETTPVLYLAKKVCYHAGNVLWQFAYLLLALALLIILLLYVLIVYLHQRKRLHEPNQPTLQHNQKEEPKRFIKQ